MEIKITTQEDLCGDEYLDNGEAFVSLCEHYFGTVVLNHNGHTCAMDLKQLELAVKILRELDIEKRQARKARG